MTTTSIYRINLLPRHITQWLLAKRIIAAFVVLFVISVALCIAGYFALVSMEKTMEQQARVAEATKKRTEGVKADITATQAQIKPVQDKLDFIKKVNDYRERWISLYRNLADYTARSGFIYTDASVTGTTMTIKAYSPKVHDVTLYLKAMYEEPDFASVKVDKVVGYPENARHLYYLDGQLVFADGAATTPIAHAAVPDPSLPRGVPVPPENYTPENVGPNGANNLPAGVGPPPPEIAVRYLGGFNGKDPAPAMAASGEAGYSPAFLRVAGHNISPFTPPQVRAQILKNALKRVVVSTLPKGFDITVTATLKQPLTPPVPPGLAPPATPGAPAATDEGTSIVGG